MTPPTPPSHPSEPLPTPKIEDIDTAIRVLEWLAFVEPGATAWVAVPSGLALIRLRAFLAAAN